MTERTQEAVQKTSEPKTTEPKRDPKEVLLDMLVSALDNAGSGPAETRQVKLKYARNALANALDAFDALARKK